MDNNGKLVTKYRVGDKVMVRDDLEIHKQYHGGNSTSDCFVGEMAEWRGEVVEIGEVSENGKYEITGDPCSWNWTDDMFAYLAEPRYKVGDRVVVRKDLVAGEEYGIDKCGAQCLFNRDMEKYLGKTLTVASVTVGDGERRWHRYRVKEDSRYWSWTDDMFEGLAGEGQSEMEMEEDDDEIDCSLADNDLLNGKVVCSETDDVDVICVGDVIVVRDGKFTYKGKSFNHVFGVSGIIWAFGNFFDTSIELIKLREAI